MNFINFLKNGKEIVNLAIEALKRKMIISGAGILAGLIIIVTIAGGEGTNVSAAATGDSGVSGTGNSDGMSDASVSESGSSTPGGTSGGSSTPGGTSGGGSTSGGTSGASAWAHINLYNSDGSVNESKLEELQLIFESQFNLVKGSASGRNIGGRYNPETCKKVTGTYLGWDGVEEGYATSYEDAVTGRQYKGKNGIGIYQCTWWANGRASEYLGRQFEVGGNGGEIYDNAAGKYGRGSTPKPNSLAVYKKEGDYGHVAYVEAVDYNQRGQISSTGNYYISHAGSGRSWYGIQGFPIGTSPWSNYNLVGFVYLDQPLN